MSSNFLNNPNVAHKRQTSIDMTTSISIGINPKLQSTAFTKKLKDYGYFTPDEFGIFRDPEGQARAMDGRIINISTDDIADILQLNFLEEQKEEEAKQPASIDAPEAIPIDAEQRETRIPAQNMTLPTEENQWETAYINEKISETCHPINNTVTWLVKRIDLLTTDLDMLRENCQQQPQPPIDTDMPASIDGRFTAVQERLDTFEAMHDK
ncbi:hypothetical protein Bca101_082751 [Brassica carinata]